MKIIDKYFLQQKQHLKQKQYKNIRERAFYAPIPDLTDKEKAFFNDYYKKLWGLR